MRCMMIANRRATATQVFLAPIRGSNVIAQAFKADDFLAMSTPERKYITRPE